MNSENIAYLESALFVDAYNAIGAMETISLLCNADMAYTVVAESMRVMMTIANAMDRYDRQVAPYEQHLQATKLALCNRFARLFPGMGKVGTYSAMDKYSRT